nr:radical SAM family heme chaperone HemW [uncultured Flavobacterium sp.]
MAGIYIHIPFCKQACHYCDFHFSTSLKHKDRMLTAILAELQMRKHEINESVETIYFGGGTPSLLSVSEINTIVDHVYDLFEVAPNPEITLEANPDDLTSEKIIALSQTKINRLSIGVQSIFDEDLKLMNRAHTATESIKNLKTAIQYFKNISVDLIYGIPNMSLQNWDQNIQFMIDLEIPHISCYALTVEPKTALDKLIKKGTIDPTDDKQAHQHFLHLIDKLKNNGYEHYEMSNFSKANFHSKNNSAYWLGKKYLGIGPSAHSYDGKNRSWNISNNLIYINKIEANQPAFEIEQLTKNDRYNEYIMTGLRTIWGVDLLIIEQNFGPNYKNYLLNEAQPFVEKKQLEIENNILKTTRDGKFFSDGISASLFKVD